MNELNQVQVQVKNLVVPHHYKNAGALQWSHKNDVIYSQTPGRNKVFNFFLKVAV